MMNDNTTPAAPAATPKTKRVRAPKKRGPGRPRIHPKGRKRDYAAERARAAKNRAKGGGIGPGRPRKNAGAIHELYGVALRQQAILDQLMRGESFGLADAGNAFAAVAAAKLVLQKYERDYLRAVSLARPATGGLK